MDYIYQYDVMGLGVLLLIQFCLYFGRHDKLKSHRYLIMIMILSGAVCFFDGVSGVLINSGNPVFYVPAHVTTVLYFIALICFPYTGMNFFLIEMGEKPRRGIYHLVPIVLSLILMIFNYPFKLFYILTPDMVYSRGPLVYLIYPIYIAYVFILYLGVRRHKRFLGKIRRTAMEIILVFSLLAAIVAYFRSGEPMAGGAMAFGVGFACLIFYFVDDIRDDVTSRLNKKGFMRMADEKLHRHDGEAFVMRIIEIYNLNEINERFGRNIGNEVIVKLSEHISDWVRGSFCAYGHVSEGVFAVLGPKGVLPRVYGNFDLGEYIESNDPNYAYSFSIYCGDYPVREPGLSIRGMMDRARFALKNVMGSYHEYKAVFEGKIRREYDRRNEIEGKVKSALANKEFTVYLQPIVDTRTGIPVSAEALIRWKDSDGRLISPGEFIPVFENNGFVSELDMFVLNEVCRTISDWEKNGISPVPVSVNISRKDLQMTNLVDNIVSTVDSYGLDHSLIKIELTESAFVEDENIIKETMERLHSYNFKLLMDDFGSGYSNLNMFDNLPVDIVKIDMRFLQNLDTSERGRIILSTVVEMTNKMGLETVVEGVETSYQYDYINKLNCQMIQGFYFSKPVPISDFTQLLVKQ